MQKQRRIYINEWRKNYTENNQSKIKNEVEEETLTISWTTTRRDHWWDEKNNNIKGKHIGT